MSLGLRVRDQGSRSRLKLKDVGLGGLGYWVAGLGLIVKGQLRVLDLRDKGVRSR